MLKTGGGLVIVIARWEGRTAGGDKASIHTGRLGAWMCCRIVVGRSSTTYEDGSGDLFV